MKSKKGITLIALIITIIVMLILVGVTINVALNGGIFEKAKKATFQTEIAQIKEQLVVKKAEKIADNNGEIPSNYGITLQSLDLPEELKAKYSNKLIISEDGNIYYDSAVVTNEQEQAKFREQGITAKTVTNNTRYSFTLKQLQDNNVSMTYDNTDSEGILIDFDGFKDVVGNGAFENIKYQMETTTEGGDVIIYNLLTDDTTYNFIGYDELIHLDDLPEGAWRIVSLTYYISTGKLYFTITDERSFAIAFGNETQMNQIIETFKNVEFYFAEFTE